MPPLVVRDEGLRTSSIISESRAAMYEDLVVTKLVVLLCGSTSALSL